MAENVHTATAPPAVECPTPPPADAGPSMASLVTGIINDAQQLIRQEVALAKSEVKEQVDRAKTAAVALGAAAAVGLLGVIHASLFVVYLLYWLFNLNDPRVEGLFPLWGAYAIVAGLFLAVAAILYFTGKNKLSQVHVVPPQTAETMRENVQWLKNQT
jgi:hypothetical protein